MTTIEGIAIKICGIRTLADGRAAAEAGADYLGFNFYPKSARYINMEACASISAALQLEYPRVRRVGVFVNCPAEEVYRTLAVCGLDLAQLHGDEPPAVLADLAPFAFKALRGVPPDLRDYLRFAPPACLLDAAVSGAYGGTGALADWSAAVALAQECAFFLAGGLNAQNVAEAVRLVRPWGVDTASGVESAPGVKDPEKMRAFVQAARAACA